MSFSHYENSVLDKVSVLVHGKTGCYNGLKTGLLGFEGIVNTILEELLESRKSNGIDKEVYRQCKFILRNALLEIKEKEEKQKFLSEPKQEIDALLEEQDYIRTAKISRGRIIIKFNDGKELEVNLDKDGMQTTFGGVSYVDSDGL